MADTSSLSQFLTDVADSIRSKTGKSDIIQASAFDTEIESISTVKNQTKSVTPSTEEQTITYDEDYTGLESVSIGAVDASIDSNITAENIKKDVTVLGVTGTLEEVNGETITITPTTEVQTITPSEGYNAITQATVTAVDSTIDSNITAENIKSGVEILGVSGSRYVVDTSDGTLTTDSVLDGYVGYSLGKKYTGTYTPAMTDSDYASALVLSRNILQGYDYTTLVTQHSYNSSSYEIPNSFYINFDNNTVSSEQYWSNQSLEEFNGYSVNSFDTFSTYENLCKNLPYIAVYVLQQEQNANVHYRRYLVINTNQKELFDCLSFNEATVTLANPTQGAYFAYTEFTMSTSSTTVANEPVDLTYYLDINNALKYINTNVFQFYGNVDYSDFSYSWLGYTPAAYLVATNF